MDALVLLQRGSLPAIPVPRVTDPSGPGTAAATPCPTSLPGSYLLTVVKAGFAPASRSVVVLPGRSLAVPVTLAPQGLSESVTVVGEAFVEASVLKLPTTLRELPRSVTVVGSDRMREENLRSVNDTLAYVPGMTVNSYRTGGYHFYSRGYRMLPDDTRIDGFAGLNAGGRYSASLFGIDQAVLLRGPAGLLYGSSGAPGGFVNLITKKPLAERMTRVDLRAGAYAGNGVSAGERPSGGFDLDSTGPLVESGRVLYRALATVENMNYFTRGVLDENRYLHGSLTFKLDAAGRNTLTPARAVDAHEPAERGRHRRLPLHVALDERRRERPDPHGRPLAARRQPLGRRRHRRDAPGRRAPGLAARRRVADRRGVPLHRLRHRHRPVRAPGDDPRAADAAARGGPGAARAVEERHRAPLPQLRRRLDLRAAPRGFLEEPLPGGPPRPPGLDPRHLAARRPCPGRSRRSTSTPAGRSRRPRTSTRRSPGAPGRTPASGTPTCRTARRSSTTG